MRRDGRGIQCDIAEIRRLAPAADSLHLNEGANEA
jgi:hypothetical protein